MSACSAMLVFHIRLKQSVAIRVRGAASVAPITVVELLGRAATSLDVTDGLGRTPLALATERRRLDVAVMLTKLASSQ